MISLDPYDPIPTWLRARCVSPFCGHSRAPPLAPWRIRWGLENPTPMMRRYFRCGSCGRKGCEFEVPRCGTGQNGLVRGYAEDYPHGKELRIAGERRWPETTPDAEKRVLAEYLARYAKAIKTVDAMCNLYSMTKGPAAIRELAKAMRDLRGNLELLPAVFPHRRAGSAGRPGWGARAAVDPLGFSSSIISGSKRRGPWLAAKLAHPKSEIASAQLQMFVAAP